MSDDFITITLVYLGTTVICLFFIAGLDLAFNTNKNIDYAVTFRVNLFVALISIVTLILAFVIAFNFLDFWDDLTNNIIALSASLIIMYFVKSYLLLDAGVTLSSHFLVTLGGLLLFAIPIYILYRMLDTFGKAFMH